MKVSENIRLQGRELAISPSHAKAKKIECLALLTYGSLSGLAQQTALLMYMIFINLAVAG